MGSLSTICSKQAAIREREAHVLLLLTGAAIHRRRLARRQALSDVPESSFCSVGSAACAHTRSEACRRRRPLRVNDASTVHPVADSGWRRPVGRVAYASADRKSTRPRRFDRRHVRGRFGGDQGLDNSESSSGGVVKRDLGLTSPPLSPESGPVRFGLQPILARLHIRLSGHLAHVQAGCERP